VGVRDRAVTVWTRVNAAVSEAVNAAREVNNHRATLTAQSLALICGDAALVNG
jgi:hypothetical protein